ncbi:MAG: addiction module protein [Candidatus Tectomicrobia bacterium]|nr:addiction module protein [Candidatus Tectomicrobia bacterium]
MTVEQIEAEVLKLPEQARAELLGWLMRSLADTPAMDQGVTEAWVQEAVHRDEEMESGSVVGISAEEAFAELRSKGK